MASTKTKGDLAELIVAADLARRGYQVSFPYGEDCDYDLIVDRNGRLERVQVKHSDSKGQVIRVQCYSSSLTNGKVKHRKPYTQSTVDWIAVYDPRTDRCYYVSSDEFASGRYQLSLRIAATRNAQTKGVRFAEDYLDLDPPRRRGMEPAGLEPAPSGLQSQRSPN